jgi:hypothetical protein
VVLSQRRDLSSSLPYGPPVLCGRELTISTKVNSFPSIFLSFFSDSHGARETLVRRTVLFKKPCSAFLAELRRSVIVRNTGLSMLSLLGSNPDLIISEPSFATSVSVFRSFPR